MCAFPIKILSAVSVMDLGTWLNIVPVDRSVEDPSEVQDAYDSLRTWVRGSLRPYKVCNGILANDMFILFVYSAI
jgi:hypothetical protein